MSREPWAAVGAGAQASKLCYPRKALENNGFCVISGSRERVTSFLPGSAKLPYGEATSFFHLKSRTLCRLGRSAS